MYQLVKRINTVVSMRTAYAYITPYSNKPKHIEKSVFSIIEQYIPYYHHLHLCPNKEFSNHYIVSDLIRGTLSSDLVAHHNNILDHSHEDILAMKVHDSYMKLYNLENEEQLAKHLITQLLDEIPVYSHN